MFLRPVVRSSACRHVACSWKTSGRVADRAAARRIHTHVSTQTQQSSIIPQVGVVCVVAGGYLLYHYTSGQKLYAEAPANEIVDKPAPAPDRNTIQLKKAPPSVKEQEKLRISSQHDQVQQFWDRPGVYLWGSNSGRVAAPDSKEEFIKAPRRLSFFDGWVLKDLQLARDVGAAVTENGDIIQWGTGYSGNFEKPEVTLRGKNIIKVRLSRDRIIALSKSGKVYTLPFSKQDQQTFPKPSESWSSWLPYFTTKSPIAYRLCSPSDLGTWEKVTDIAAGLEHAVMLTSSGRVYTCAAAGGSFPEKGQLGIPGMTWASRPKGPFDMPHELLTLKGFNIKKIAAGAAHTVMVDDDGRIFSFGDNTNGQLGFDYASDFIPVPTILPMRSFYKENVVAKCIDVAAGGRNTYFTIEVEDLKRNLALVDLFSCGCGVTGSLGTGKWSHASGIPKKIPALSGLSEYSDKLQKVVPISYSYISIGSTHVAAVMSNLTHLGATDKNNDVNYGADILFFGGNEFYQIGTGKRNNIPLPTYIPPLDDVSDPGLGKREEHRLQVVPAHKARITDMNGKKRTVKVEQRVVAGSGLTGCYAMAA